MPYLWNYIYGCVGAPVVGAAVVGAAVVGLGVVLFYEKFS